MANDCNGVLSETIPVEPGPSLLYSRNSCDFTFTQAVIASIEGVDEEIGYHEAALRSRGLKALGIVASLARGNLWCRAIWIKEIGHHKRELKRLRQLRLGYELLLSPLHRIPIEILEYIFDYAVEKNCFGWQKSQCRSDAYNLGWVCSRWRRVAQSMPHLWVNISIKINRSVVYPSMAVRQLEDHLLLSAGSLLFVEVELEAVGNVVDYVPHSNSEKLCNLVVEQSPRWRSFRYIHSSRRPYGYARFLEMFLNRAMPALESLEVDLGQTYNRQLPPQLLPHLLISPLHTVRLSPGGNKIPRFVETLPSVRHLTHLQVEVYTRDAVRLLLSCRSLVTAHFILLVPTSRRISPEAHERLRALTLESSSLHQTSHFLSALTCPSLMSLSLSAGTTFEIQRNEWPRIASSRFTKNLIRFLQRSNGSEALKALRLANTPLEPSHFIRILHKTSRLRTLEIVSKVASNDAPPSILFHALHSWSNEMEHSTLFSRKTAPLVPVLQEVRFTFDNDWRSNAFESMLQSRVGGRLESAFLKIRGQRNYLDLDHLQRINAKTNLAVRVVEGDDEREVVGYCEPHPESKIPHSGENLLQQLTSRLCYSREAEAIDSIKASVQSINEEIAIANNETDIQRLKQLRVEIQTLLSPFHRVPIGVLTYIFEYAVEKNTFGWEQPHFTSDVYKLAHTCRRWRKLTESKSMSHLWANISLKVNPNAYYPPIALQRLKYHLLRSSYSPLSLEMEVFTGTPTGYADSSTEFLDVLLQQAHLWKSFKYIERHVGDQGQTSSLLDLVLTRQLRTLQRLEVDVDPSDDHKVPPQLERVLLKSPLQAIHLSFGASRMAFLFPNLQSIRLLTEICVEVYPADALYLVSSCRNLATAHFKLMAGTKIDVDSMDFGRIFNKGLRELAVESPSETPLCPITFFLLSLTCPSLTSMSIFASLPSKEDMWFHKDNHEDDVRSGFFTNQLIEFFQRSNSREVLKTFRLVENIFTTSEIIDILCALPSLHTLEMDIPNIHIACLFQILNPWTSSTSFDSTDHHGRAVSFPTLRNVKFTVETVSGTHEFRTLPRFPLPWHTKRLRSVFLKLTGDAGSLDVEWLEWLNTNADLAVRVVEGDDEREVVGYWVKPAVGLRRSSWRDLLSP